MGKREEAISLGISRFFSFHNFSLTFHFFRLLQLILKEVTGLDKIANIYLYCDRWCERCAFGNRCEAFAANETYRKKENMQADDEKNRLFWEDIESKMDGVFHELEEKARVLGKDLTVFEGLSKAKKFDLFQRKAVSNDVLKAGRKYEDLVDDWLDAMADKGVLKMMEFLPGSVFRVAADDFTEDEKNHANSLIEVIMRYQLQIYLKLSRLYYTLGKESEEDWNSGDEMASDVTAKMVLHIIRRSLVAWSGLMKYFPDGDGHALLDISLLLMRMKNRLEMEFPHADMAVRPGFDGY